MTGLLHYDFPYIWPHLSSCVLNNVSLYAERLLAVEATYSCPSVLRLQKGAPWVVEMKISETSSFLSTLIFATSHNAL